MLAKTIRYPYMSFSVLSSDFTGSVINPCFKFLETFIIVQLQFAIYVIEGVWQKTTLMSAEQDYMHVISKQDLLTNHDRPHPCAQRFSTKEDLQLHIPCIISRIVRITARYFHWEVNFLSMWQMLMTIKISVNLMVTKVAFLWEDPDQDLWSKITQIVVYQRNGTLVRSISCHDSKREVLPSACQQNARGLHNKQTH